MQGGQYITNRWIEAIIPELCDKKVIEYASFSSDWIWMLRKNGQTRYVAGYKFSLNDGAAGSIACDKVACYEVLSHGGVPAIEHILIRSGAQWMSVESEMVLKPLGGTGGRYISLVKDKVDLRSRIEALPGIEAWTLSPFEHIKREVRYIILDDSVLLSFEKIPVQKGEMKFFNLGLGGRAVDSKPTREMTELSIKAMRVIGLRLASVDIVELEDGSVKVLEINDGIMMENYMRQSNENKNRAVKVYGAIIDAMFS